MFTRIAARAGSRNLTNLAPYQSDSKKFISPISWVKYKMNIIDKSRDLYEICSTNDSHSLHKNMELSQHFEGWFNATTLHVWMLQKKLHSIYGQLNNNNTEKIYKDDEARAALELSQELTRHVWLDVEIKLAQAGVKMKISHILTDLVSSFQGQGLAYDEGLYYGDAILAAALWRNLYICNKEVSLHQIAQSLEYVRKNLQKLDGMKLDDVLHKDFKFLAGEQ